MTTGQQDSIDQRLDQHSDAFESMFDRLDSLDHRLRILLRRIDIYKARIKELESIVLPAAKDDPSDGA